MTTINVLDASGSVKSIARIPDTGQMNMANSLPVVLASDQSPLTTGNITNKFRDAFESYTPGLIWDESKQVGDIDQVRWKRRRRIVSGYFERSIQSKL